MDNWDRFQQNLGIAQGSEGTLQEQADIYAESWEAARDRVKAATESLYDTLINDKFFIELNNTLENIISGVDKFIQNLGGVKAVIGGIVAFTLSAVSSRIEPAVQKVIQDIRVITGGANKVYQSMQNEFAQGTQDFLAQNGLQNNQPLKTELEGYNQILLAKTKISAINDQLNAKEKMDAQLRLEGLKLQVAENNRLAIEEQKRIDIKDKLIEKEKEEQNKLKNIRAEATRKREIEIQAEEQKRTQLTKKASEEQQKILDQERLLRQKKQQEIYQQEKLITSGMIAQQKEAADKEVSKSFDTLRKEAGYKSTILDNRSIMATALRGENNEGKKALSELNNEIQKTANNIRVSLVDAIGSGTKEAVNLRDNFTSIQQTVEKLQLNKNSTITDLEASQKKLGVIKDSFAPILKENKGVEEAFNAALKIDPKDGAFVQTYNQHLNILKSRLEEINIPAAKVQNILKSLGLNTPSLEKYTAALEKQKQAMEELAQAQEKLKQLRDNGKGFSAEIIDLEKQVESLKKSSTAAKELEKAEERLEALRQSSVNNSKEVIAQEEKVAEAKRKVAKADEEVIKATNARQQGQQQAQNQVNQLSPTHTMSSIEGITKTAAGLGQTAMAINSLSSMIRTCQSDTSTLVEKITSIGMAASFAIPSTIGAFKNLSQVLKGIAASSVGLQSVLMLPTLNKAKAPVLNDFTKLVIQFKALEKYTATSQEKQGIQNRLAASFIGSANAQILDKESKAALQAAIAKGDLAAAEGILNGATATTTATIGASILTMLEAVAVIAVVVAAIAGLVMWGKHLNEVYNADALAAERAAKSAEQLAQVAQKAQEKAESLKTAISSYDSAVDRLKECTKGTKEWDEALQSVKTSADDVLQQIKKVASPEDYKKLTEDFLATNTLDSDILEKYEDKLNQEASQMKITQARAEYEAAIASRTSGITNLARSASTESYDDQGAYLGDNSQEIAQKITNNFDLLYSAASGTTEGFARAVKNAGIDIENIDITGWQSKILAMGDNAEKAAIQLGYISGSNGPYKSFGANQIYEQEMHDTETKYASDFQNFIEGHGVAGYGFGKKLSSSIRDASNTNYQSFVQFLKSLGMDVEVSGKNNVVQNSIGKNRKYALVLNGIDDFYNESAIYNAALPYFLEALENGQLPDIYNPNTANEKPHSRSEEYNRLFESLTPEQQEILNKFDSTRNQETGEYDFTKLFTELSIRELEKLQNNVNSAKEVLSKAFGDIEIDKLIAILSMNIEDWQKQIQQGAETSLQLIEDTPLKFDERWANYVNEQNLKNEALANEAKEATGLSDTEEAIEEYRTQLNNTIQEETNNLKTQQSQLEGLNLQANETSQEILQAANSRDAAQQAYDAYQANKMSSEDYATLIRNKELAPYTITDAEEAFKEYNSARTKAQIADNNYQEALNNATKALTELTQARSRQAEIEEKLENINGMPWDEAVALLNASQEASHSVDIALENYEAAKLQLEGAHNDKEKAEEILATKGNYTELEEQLDQAKKDKEKYDEAYEEYLTALNEARKNIADINEYNAEIARLSEKYGGILEERTQIENEINETSQKIAEAQDKLTRLGIYDKGLDYYNENIKQYQSLPTQEFYKLLYPEDSSILSLKDMPNAGAIGAKLFEVYDTLGKEGLEAFAQSIENVLKDSDKASDILRLLGDTSFSSSTDIAKLRDKIAEISGTTPGAVSALDELLKKLQEFSGLTTTREGAEKFYNEVHSITDKFKEDGTGTITKEEYSKLIALAEQKGYTEEDIKAFLRLNKFGEYELDPFANPQAVSNFFNSLADTGFKDIVAFSQNNAKKIQTLQEQGYDIYSSDVENLLPKASASELSYKEKIKALQESGQDYWAQQWSSRDLYDADFAAIDEAYSNLQKGPVSNIPELILGRKDYLAEQGWEPEDLDKMSNDDIIQAIVDETAKNRLAYSGTNLETIEEQNQHFNAQLTLLESLGEATQDLYNKYNDGTLEQRNEAMEEATERIRAITDETTTLNDVETELNNTYYETSELLEESKILDEASAIGITREEIRLYADELIRANKASSKLMALKMAKDLLEEAQGVKELKENFEDYEKAVREYNEAIKEGRNASTAAITTFDKMEKIVKKLVHGNLSKAERAYLRTTDAVKKLDKAQSGLYDDIRAFDKQMGRVGTLSRFLPEGEKERLIAALEDINVDTEQTINNFESILEKTSPEISSALDTIRFELENFNPGDLLDTGSIAGAIDTMLAELERGKASTGEIIDAFADEGIEAVPHFNPPTVTTVKGEGVYDSIHSFYPYDVDTVQYEKEATIPDNTNVTIKSDVQTWEFRKKGDSSSSSTPSGGGGGGGGGSKRKAPTPHKKSDMGKRYHRVKEQIVDRKREQDEAERRKDREFGAAKLDQLEKEIKLRRENIKLQGEYIDQINGFLKGDRQDLIASAATLTNELKDVFKIDITPIFDSEGVITNYQEIEDELLRLENQMIDIENEFNTTGQEMPEGMKIEMDIIQNYLDDVREYQDRYEETLNLLEEQTNALNEQIDELSDALFEIITTKVELQIGINDDEASKLEYFLTKYEDNAYRAAEAIALFGDQAENQLKRIGIYTEGITELLATKGLTLADLNNLDDSGIRRLIEEGDFTQEQVDSIREWRDGLLEANQAMMELRTNIAERVLDTFDQLNEKVENSYDLFDHYNSILETYKDITDLLGQQINNQQRQLIDNLNNAMLENQKNAVTTARARYEDLVAERERAQELYDTALAEGGEDAAQRYEEMLTSIDEALRDAQEEYLSQWQETADLAQQIFETMLDNIVKDFEESMSGTFGSLDYLQEAFDRRGEIDDMYLDDYEKLHELNKLQRDLNKVLSDTRGLTNRQDLMELQEQIVAAQREGVRLSQYDLDVMRAKFELQQAYNDLQLAQDAKQTVRLQRDNMGNWGYVYTADEDAVAEAEQAYEDKLYEYQKLNDEYIQELQERALQAQTTYRDLLQEVMSDMTLSDGERAARIAEINDWLAQQQGYFAEQTEHALDNQAGTLDRMLRTYEASSAELLDAWDETKLSDLTGIETLVSYMDNWIANSSDYLDKLQQALQTRQDTMDEIVNLAGGSVQDFGDTITNAIQQTSSASAMQVEAVAALTTLLNSEFGIAIKEATSWEEEYAKQIDAATKANEAMTDSVNALIAALNELSSVNPFHDEIDKFIDISKQHMDGRIDDRTFLSYATEFGQQLAGAAGYDTGGYTGTWGAGGKLAVLHEKEEIFDANDTENLLEASQILRRLDMSTAYMANGFGNLISPAIGETGMVFEQSITIEEVSFPNATDRTEIEAAFENIASRAVQYANRKNEG